VGLFDGMPCIFGSWILAFVGMQHHRECLVLLLDFFLSGSSLQLQHVIWIVEFFIGESFYLYVCLEGLGFDGLVFDGVDLAGVV